MADLEMPDSLEEKVARCQMERAHLYQGWMESESYPLISCLRDYGKIVHNYKVESDLELRRVNQEYTRGIVSELEERAEGFHEAAKIVDHDLEVVDKLLGEPGNHAISYSEVYHMGQNDLLTEKPEDLARALDVARERYSLLLHRVKEEAEKVGELNLRHLDCPNLANPAGDFDSFRTPKFILPQEHKHSRQDSHHED